MKLAHWVAAIGFSFTVLVGMTWGEDWVRGQTNINGSGSLPPLWGKVRMGGEYDIPPPPLSSPARGEEDVSPIDSRNDDGDLEDLIDPALLTEPGEIRILTAKLPAGFLNEPYQQPIRVAGARQPYQWELLNGALPEGLTFDFRNGVFFGVPANEAAQNLELQITDAAGRQAKAEFILIVRARAGQNSSDSETLSIREEKLPNGFVGKAYRYEFRANGGTGPYSWSVEKNDLPKGLRLVREEGILFGAPQADGNFSFTVQVKDQKGALAELFVRMFVDTSPLYLTSSKLADGFVGRSYSFRLEAQGGLPPYRWALRSGRLPKGLSLGTSSGVVSGIPEEAAQAALTLAVLDSENGFDGAELRIVIGGGALTIPERELPQGIVGKPYYAALHAEGGRPPYQWKAADERLWEGLSLQEHSGVVSGTPKKPFFKTIKFVVTDAAGETAGRSVSLKVLEKDLKLNLPPSFTISAGQFFFFEIQAEGGIPDYLWNPLSGFPDWLSLSSSGTLFGIPTRAGRSLAGLQVFDQSGTSESAHLAILAVQEPLEITTAELPQGSAKESYFARLSARGGAPPYRWHLSRGALPGGYGLDSLSGFLSGTTIESGQFSFEIGVTDDEDQRAVAPFTLFVIPVRLQFETPARLPNGFAGKWYSVPVEVSGGIPPYSWRVVSGGLPDGLQIGRESGVISGTPDDGFSASFEVEVEDGAGTRIRQLFSLLIEGTKLKMTTVELPKAVVGEPYAAQFQAEGGTEPYRWFLVDGVLPKSLNLDSEAGRLFGAPEVEGTFRILVQVQDANRGEAGKSFTLVVQAAPLIIETQDLPAAHLNELYRTEFAAKGGTQPYVWSVAGGRLPDKINLDGAAGKLEGIPEAAGEFRIRARVTDRAGRNTEREFTLVVLEGAPKPIEGLIAAPSDAKAGLAWRFPNDSSIVEARVYRSIGAPPEIKAMNLIYSGKEDNIVDSGLTNGTQYFYAAQTVNHRGRTSDITEESQASATPRQVTLTGPADPFADDVRSYAPLNPVSWGSNYLPQNVTGSPEAGFSASFPQASPAEVLSLGAKKNDDDGASPPYGGSVVLEFTNNIIVNGPGVDFTVFENVMFVGGDPANRFMEPAVVSVSLDGKLFYPFPFDYVRHTNDADEEVMNNPFSYAAGFAGINPVYARTGGPDPRNPNVSGGDSFDLSRIPGKRLNWVRFVRIQSTGDNWLVDWDGDRVRHTSEQRALDPNWKWYGFNNSGFDLDAVCAVNY